MQAAKRGSVAECCRHGEEKWQWQGCGDDCLPVSAWPEVNALGTSLGPYLQVLHCIIALFVPRMWHRSELQTTVLVLTRPRRTHSGQRNRFFLFSGIGLCRSIAPAPPCVDQRRCFLCFTHRDRTHRSGMPWRQASLAANALMIAYIIFKKRTVRYH